MSILVQIWLLSTLLILAVHLAVAYLIDRCLDFGTWTKAALLLFIVLGPLGVILETVLILQVLRDIHRQKLAGQTTTSSYHHNRHTWLSKPSRRRTKYA